MQLGWAGGGGGLSDFCYGLHLKVLIQGELLAGALVPDTMAKPWISVDATTDARVQTQGSAGQLGGEGQTPPPAGSSRALRLCYGAPDLDEASSQLAMTPTELPWARDLTLWASVLPL